MLPESLTRFRLLVLQDQLLQEQLRDLEDREDFILRVVELGRLNGCEFTDQNVTEGLQAGRRVWLERWI